MSARWVAGSAVCAGLLGWLGGRAVASAVGADRRASVPIYIMEVRK
jgi:hypothetical protein